MSISESPAIGLLLDFVLYGNRFLGSAWGVDLHLLTFKRCIDLGLVDYVFSDKTGTLTSNEMQLRLLAIKESTFGSVDFK